MPDPSTPPGISGEARRAIESEINARLVREILVAMCRKQGISIRSPWYPDEEEARNYTLAQRLGIGSVFGIPDNEEEQKQ